MKKKPSRGQRRNQQPKKPCLRQPQPNFERNWHIRFLTTGPEASREPTQPIGLPETTKFASPGHTRNGPPQQSVHSTHPDFAARRHTFSNETQSTSSFRQRKALAENPGLPNEALDGSEHPVCVPNKNGQRRTMGVPMVLHDISIMILLCYFEAGALMKRLL